MLNPGPRLSISDAEFVSFVSERYSPPRTEYAKPRRPAAAAASAMCCAERYGRTAALAAQPAAHCQPSRPKLEGRISPSTESTCAQVRSATQRAVALAVRGLRFGFRMVC
jgi:hypothetical protein